MKIAILNNAVPFVRGGAEHLADALVSKLQEYGHQAILVRIPLEWDPPSKILEQMLACRLMRLPGVDRVIGLKFPAYYVPHHSKMVWLLHQFRQVYDLWGTPLQGMPDNTDVRELRRVIFRADQTYLAEAAEIFTNSKVTGDRLARFNGLGSKILYPPLLAPEQFQCKEYGDYILALGRVNEAKRQHLLVESMRYCRSNVKLMIAGKAETSEYAKSLSRLISGQGLQQRVQFVERFITEEEKVDFLSRALGVAYVPYDEDSFGYVTLEAFLSNKPVLTCDDSGGILEFVKDNVTGHVCKAEPQSIARAMDQLYEDKRLTCALGEAGRALLTQFEISWDHVIQVLTS